MYTFVDALLGKMQTSRKFICLLRKTINELEVALNISLVDENLMLLKHVKFDTLQLYIIQRMVMLYIPRTPIGIRFDEVFDYSIRECNCSTSKTLNMGETCISQYNNNIKTDPVIESDILSLMEYAAFAEAQFANNYRSNTPPIVICKNPKHMGKAHYMWSHMTCPDVKKYLVKKNLIK
jgi:hypothetical protein